MTFISRREAISERRPSVTARIRTLWSTDRSRANVVAAVVFALQFLFLVSNSALEIGRDSLTLDFQYNGQAVYLMGRGDYNPHVFGGGSPNRYFDDHCEYMMHVFGLLGRVIPTVPLLKYAQDLSLVLTGVLAWILISRACETQASPQARWAVRITGLSLLVLNPWTYWTALWDVHEQVLAMPLLLGGIVLAASGRKALSFAAFALTLGFGDVTATWVFGTGLTLALKRELRLFGLGLAASALVVFEAMSRVKAASPHNVASLGVFYGYVLDPGQDALKASFGPIVLGALRHPERVLERTWSQALNVWANLAPSGVIGSLHPFALGTSVLTLAESSMTGAAVYAQPGFQNAPVYALGALGTTLFLATLIRRKPRLGIVLCACATLNVVLWGVPFIASARHHWVRVTKEDGVEMRAVLRNIPNEQQVVISQGLIGGAALRHDVFAFLGQAKFFARKPTDVVVAPYTGINVETSNELATDLKFWIFAAHARLLSHDRDVWHMRVPTWPPAMTESQLAAAARTSSDETAVYPAWAFRVAAGTTVLGTSSAASYVRSTGARGFVVSEIYPYLRAGAYRISARVRTDGPLVFEIYDPYLRRFVARVPINASPALGMHDVDVALPEEHEDPHDLDAGSGPFRFLPIFPFPGSDKLELRIFNPGGAHADIYDFTIRPSGGVSVAHR